MKRISLWCGVRLNGRKKAPLITGNLVVKNLVVTPEKNGVPEL